VEAERRQVTVLFTDMVGFTTFSEKSGEEAAFNLMRSLAKLMDDAVTEQGGVVQGFTGDGVMAVFGAPMAFEDAPLRACRAALSILQRLKLAGPRLKSEHGEEPHIRIGLNTGTAIVGQVHSSTAAGVTVLGDAVNFAARLQAMAEPDSVLMSEATHRLLQGMVDATFTGEHNVRGKSGPQKTYRLEAIRKGATRFEAAVSRGLGTFVGREHELELLERRLMEARSKLQVLDLEAEPGMGKSRLLYEFRQRVDENRTFVLSGNCSPDSQQSPFFPFIEVVRGSFRLSSGEAEKDITQKFELGLTSLGLHSTRNLGLLLHLLGLRVPEGALDGLDGMLIGLRTRELLQQLLESLCKLLPVIMVLEDLHWIDSGSEELLGRIVDSEKRLRLLLVHTHRPEYAPPWLDRPIVTKLRLEPLPLGDIRRLVQARLSEEVVSETLVREVAEKAGGNPLFAEEIVSFLGEQGMLRPHDGKFDPKSLTAGVPASLQSLLTARVDRLQPNDRTLLQAASVIGRHFDTELLAVVCNGADTIDDRLAAMQALDLIHKEGQSSGYSFKHALVRDALYQSLLTETRSLMHLRIAEEIERRSGNRLIEVAETLALHYRQTDRAEKAFTFGSLAGSRSLSVYSLEEAEVYFCAAIALIENKPGCATDEQIAHLLADYTRLQNALGKVTAVVDISDKFESRLNNLGDNPEVVFLAHQKMFGLCFMTEFQTALAEQAAITSMAERLGDDRSRVYSFASQILIASAIAPQKIEDQERLVKNALEAASGIEDTYIRSVIRWVIAIDEIGRGRMTRSRQIAEEMCAIGHDFNDPRPRGMGMGVLGWIALTSDDYERALSCAEECLRIAFTPQERLNALGVKGSALALLRRLEEGQFVLNDTRKQLIDLNWRYELLLLEPAFGVLAVLNGQIGKGIHTIEKAIATARHAGWRAAEDWAKLFLCEVYLEIMFPKERPSFNLLLHNILILSKILFIGRSSIEALISQVRSNPQFDRKGHHIGRAEMILGLLYKGKRKRALAAQHLIEAKRIFCQFGRTPVLARVDAALAELGE
jgi:class 3 adenylate cyclase